MFLIPVTVSAPKSHVRPKRNMTPAILMTNLIAVFMFICSFVRSSLFKVYLTRTPITKTKMTTLTIRMAKMGPRKAPKNTVVSLMKQLEENTSHSRLSHATTEYINECTNVVYSSKYKN